MDRGETRNSDIGNKIIKKEKNYFWWESFKFLRVKIIKMIYFKENFKIIRDLKPFKAKFDSALAVEVEVDRRGGDVV